MNAKDRVRFHHTSRPVGDYLTTSGSWTDERFEDLVFCHVLCSTPITQSTLKALRLGSLREQERI